MTVGGFYESITKTPLRSPFVHGIFRSSDPLFSGPDFKPGSISMDHEGRDGKAVCCLLFVRAFIFQKLAEVHGLGAHSFRIFLHADKGRISYEISFHGQLHTQFHHRKELRREGPAIRKTVIWILLLPGWAGYMMFFCSFCGLSAVFAAKMWIEEKNRSCPSF